MNGQDERHREKQRGGFDHERPRPEQVQGADERQRHEDRTITRPDVQHVEREPSGDERCDEEGDRYASARGMEIK